VSPADVGARHRARHERGPPVGEHPDPVGVGRLAATGAEGAVLLREVGAALPVAGDDPPFAVDGVVTEVRLQLRFGVAQRGAISSARRRNAAAESSPCASTSRITTLPRLRSTVWIP